MEDTQIVAPTKEQPLLVGLLIDVLGSMTTSLNNSSGQSLNRLQGFQAALEKFASRAKEISQGQEEGRVKFFAYGFGFGNPVAAFLGSSGASGSFGSWAKLMLC